MKKAGVVKYTLPPSMISTDSGDALRAAFFSNWTRHWARVRDLCPFADIHTLIGFIREADRISFWHHVGLQEWFLPYIFLSMCDFPPPKGASAARRPEWLRFMFDVRVRTIDDLWIRVALPFTFTRLAYLAPTRGLKPGHLIRQEPALPVDDTFLRSPAPAPHPYAASEMKKAFPAELP